MCAAKGLLPGQGGRTIKFARAPNRLDLGLNNRLGVCSGWVPPHAPSGGIFGYATDDIFYLESCLFSQICRNGHEIFELRKGHAFECDLDVGLFRELQGLLLTPGRRPPNERQCRGAQLFHEMTREQAIANAMANVQQEANRGSRCEDWCTEWNCWQKDCAGCGAERGC